MRKPKLYLTLFIILPLSQAICNNRPINSCEYYAKLELNEGEQAFKVYNDYPQYPKRKAFLGKVISCYKTGIGTAFKESCPGQAYRLLSQGTPWSIYYVPPLDGDYIDNLEKRWFEKLTLIAHC